MKHHKYVFLIIMVMLLVSATFQQAQESQDPREMALVKTINEELISKPPSKLMLDPFYEKYVDAMGIPVIASAAVSDTALLVARDIIIHMLSERPDIRRALVQSGQKVGIIGYAQQISDIPEYTNMKKTRMRRQAPDRQRNRGIRQNPKNDRSRVLEQAL